jgi:hypothetical protein
MLESYVNILARLDHEQRRQAMVLVLDNGMPMSDGRPGRVSRQVGRLLYTLGNRMASLGEQMSQPQERSLEGRLTAQE